MLLTTDEYLYEVRMNLTLLDRIISFHKFASNEYRCHHCVGASLVFIKKCNLAFLYIDEVEHKFGSAVSMARYPILSHIVTLFLEYKRRQQDIQRQGTVVS